MSRGANRGRRSKGARHQIGVRAPVDQYERYKEKADQLGLDLSDYIVLVLARVHGQPVPRYIVEALQPGQMPLEFEVASEPRRLDELLAG